MSDLSKLTIKPTKRSVATSPRKIFKSLTLRGSIQNIWEPQAEALAGWEKERKAPDVVIQMNTGGGKTLGGLLIAQSLVNETKRQGSLRMSDEPIGRASGGQSC